MSQFAFESDLCDPTEEHRLLRETVRDFTRQAIEPQADEHDRSGVFNRGLFEECGKIGLLGVTVPSDDGGAGMDAVAAVIAHHEMAKSDPGFTLGYLAHAMLFVNNFYYGASPEQRRRYLDKVVTGEWIGAMGMTEPSGGTDVLGMKTSATRDKGGYRITGRKALITNAPDANIFLIYAKLDGRITSFLIERAFKGLTTGSPTHKMGMRASTMGEIVMDDCFVPTENVLGGEGQGVIHMMRNLEIERITLAAMSLGIADRCLDIMVNYAKERTSFGKPLADFGQVQRYIGESYARTEAARALVYGVARTIRHDRRNRLGSDAAKLFAAPVGKEVADNAMQVLGGWGYCDEFKVERFLRDAKLLEIGGGTLESHQKNITRDLTET
jgi:isovaleryl-CoA dehydrogenase